MMGGPTQRPRAKWPRRAVESVLALTVALFLFAIVLAPLWR